MNVLHFQRPNHNFLISWCNTLELISPFDLLLALSCHHAPHLSAYLLTPAVKMLFDIFSSMLVFLPSLLHLFLFSFAMKLCHCLLPAWAGWGSGGGWGYLNDLVCSDSTILFHCRSLRLISLMDYEQGNKNRGRQSENDWTPCKGPAGNGLQPDK